MGFSEEWDACYKQNTHMNRWPWTDLVSCTLRYARPRQAGGRVLELGCGNGNNIGFLQSVFEAGEYCGVDGSEHIVKRLRDAQPDLDVKCADFTHTIPFSGQFDLIVDRAAMTHNTTQAIRNGLDLVYNKLRPGGKFIGIDLFSTEHSEYGRGSPGDDIFTRTGYTEGCFALVGRVHFWDSQHIGDLFSRFEIIMLEHRLVRREIPDDGFVLATWNLVAQKGEA